MAGKVDKRQVQGPSSNSRKRKLGKQKNVITKKPKSVGGKNTKSLVSGQCMEVKAIESSLKAALEALHHYKKRDSDSQLIEGRLVKSKAEIKRLTDKKNKLADDLQKTKKTIKWYREKYDQLKKLETQFAKLKAELEHMAEEKGQICKELEGVRQVLQKKERGHQTYIDIDDSLNCSICMEPWTQSGKHNISSLACGHFFGRSCITKWINKTGPSSSKCPQCSKKATLTDLRSHYLQQVSVADGKNQQNKKITK